MQKIQLIGHLGKDPDLHHFDDGGKIANTSIAVTEKWKNKAGEKQERTEWFNLTFRDKLAGIVQDYLHKGDKVYVEGKQRTRTYDKDGATQYVKDVEVFNLEMLGGRQEQAPQQETKQNAPPPSIDDDLPFN